MIHKLKQKLVFIYSCSTSIILITVIIVLFLTNYHERLYRLKSEYNQNIVNIFEELKDSQVISSSWLAHTEKETGILIIMEDNGIDLRLLNTFTTRINKDKLKEELQKAAKEDGLDCKNPIFHSSTYKSNNYLLHKNEETYYYGTLMITPIKNGYRIIYLLMEVSKYYGIDRLFLLRYGGMTFLGIFFLFLFSKYFIQLVLKPLEENQIQQKQFIASVSHEMKSPLTVITTGISNLRTELYKDTNPTERIEQCKSFIPIMENECTRSSKLINDMLMLAATDSHSWQLNLTDIDMETLLIELYDFYSIYEGSLHRAFHFDLSSDTLNHVRGDLDRIKQILTILIDNGYRYTPPEKGITLKAYNTKHHVSIEIIDYGVGIEDSQKELVFNRFYRMDSSRSNKSNFGLGLSIARELVTLHHGKLYVKDTPGGGATFCIELPIL
jgi:two-component system, OmpR family, manganese sensing sensor histidine kinase